jgi:tetratricopeptide (TPR) repeat protein
MFIALTLAAGAAALQSPRKTVLAALTLCTALGLGLALQTTHAADAPAATAAAPAAMSEAAYNHALSLFNKALAGDESALGGAMSAWQSLVSGDPTNPVPRGYLGSATAMQATTTILPWKKMGFAEDGLALLDKALAQLTPAHDQQLVGGVPASLHVRFNAASTFSALPSMFNRSERGAKLMDDLLKNPLLEASPLGFKAAVWLRAGQDAQRAKRTDEARQLLQKVAASGAPQAAAAQAQLKSL